MNTVSPHNYKLEELIARITDVDAFISCASFESRCLSIAQALEGKEPSSAHVGRFNQQPGRTNELFNQLMSLAGRNAVEMALDLSNPIATADAVYSALHEIQNRGAKSVAIDVSTFTHEVVLILYKLIPVVLGGGIAVDFLYTGASEYSVGDESKNKWLSRGIREVRSVIGYPGELLPSQGIHLILLAGFEIDRALGLIREFEPSHVSLGCGDSNVSFTKPHQPTNDETIAAIQRAQSIVSEVEVFKFNPYSPDEVCAAVEVQWRKYEGMNTVVAPLNTKLSTLGVAQFATQFEEVQVCYAQPLVYNVEKYSTPRDDVWAWKHPSTRSC